LIRLIRFIGALKNKAPFLLSNFSDRMKIQYKYFMVRFLGLIDILAGLILLSIGSKIQVPIGVLIFIPICLFIKACLSLADIGGITDLVVAILIVLSIFIAMPWPILLIALIIMAIKGGISLFS
jgi:hypothetical protein